VYGNSGVNIYRNTTVINNYYTHNNRRYQAGPRFDEIRRVTNRPVRVYDVRDNDRPGRMEVGRDRVNIYRPNIERAGNDRGPARVTDNRNANRYGSRNDRPDNNANTRRGGTIDWQMGSSNPGNQRPERNNTHSNTATGGTVTNDRSNAASQAQQQRARQQQQAIQQQQRAAQQRAEQSRSNARQEQSRQPQQRNGEGRSSNGRPGRG
jgi:hypothetical protein